MRHWEKVVILKLRHPVLATVAVADANRAARLLLNDWPEKSGKSYRRAVLNCLGAIKGKISQDAAQWAFTVAAMEAAIPFEIKDRMEMEIAAICAAMLVEEGARRENPTPAVSARLDPDPVTQPFWWSRPPASGRSVR